MLEAVEDSLRLEKSAVLQLPDELHDMSGLSADIAVEEIVRGYSAVIGGIAPFAERAVYVRPTLRHVLSACEELYVSRLEICLNVKFHF